jgi:uncharacterized SAM-binding protein YcdF (DUF218 family)
MSLLRNVLDFLTTPSTLFLAVACLALLALLIGWRRGAISCLALSLGGFIAFGITSLSEVMIAPLVTRFPPVDLAQAEPPFGLIVLGAGLNEVHAAHNGALMELEDGGEAVPIAALLARRFPKARIILSGGTGTDVPPAPLRATDGMRRLLMEFGVSEDRIMTDPNSPSTALRARNTLALVGEDRDQVWWVITPAHRMPRLMGAYRKIGFDPTPYPIDFKWIPPFSPTYVYGFTDGLALSDAGAKEWRGLLFYYLTDKIDTLFPGP